VVEVDFGGGLGAEASAVLPAVVLSNDTGNYFGRTFLVAPRCEPGWIPVETGSGSFDLGRLRVVDVDRIVGGSSTDLAPVDLTRIGDRLESMLP
jgi:mRNA-degrading endonuclease toxin of MazEF toxin-antitoxin module